MFGIEAIPSLAGLDRAIGTILVSEIGDKTFLIAAILSMRHPRIIVFSGSILALGLMSLLSSLLGAILPTLLPKRYTTASAAVLFFVFGAKMVLEGMAMESGDKGREKMDEEMREVQKEVEEAEEGIAGRSKEGGGVGPQSFALSDLEEGRLDAGAEGSRSRVPSPGVGRGATCRRGSFTVPNKEDAWTGLKEGTQNLCNLFFSPILVQAFILTFLAEWGDRSQIATIALAAAHNVWLVTIGTTLGHSVCTLMAVMFGRWISQHISIKHVTLGGAALFLLFGVIYAYEAFFWDELDSVVDALAPTLRLV